MTIELLGREDHHLTDATFVKYLNQVHEKILTVCFPKMNGCSNILSADQSNKLIFFPNLRNLSMVNVYFNNKTIQLHEGLQTLKIDSVNFSDIAKLPATLQSLEITIGVEEAQTNWIDMLPKTLTRLSCPLSSLIDQNNGLWLIDFQQFPSTLEELDVTCPDILDYIPPFKKQFGHLPESLKSLSIFISMDEFEEIVDENTFELPKNLISFSFNSRSKINLTKADIEGLPKSLRHLNLFNAHLDEVVFESFPSELLSLRLPSLTQNITIEDLAKLPACLKSIRNLELPISLLNRVPEIFKILPKQLSEIELIVPVDSDEVEEIHICKYLNLLPASITKLSMNFIAARVDWKEIVWPVNLTDLTITGYVSQEKEEEAIFTSQLPHLTNLVISGTFNQESLAAVLPKTIESVCLKNDYKSTVLDYGRVIKTDMEEE